MANLIITVISIALVAVAALMGAYYGGQAFMDGQAKARANAVLAAAEQVAGAWRLYAADHNGSFTLTDAEWSDGTDNDIVPKYLASAPYFSYADAIAKVGYPRFSYYFIPVLLANDTHVDFDPNSNAIYLIGIPKNVCEQLNLMATGTASAPSTHWAGYVNSAVAMATLKPFIAVPTALVLITILFTGFFRHPLN